MTGQKGTRWVLTGEVGPDGVGETVVEAYRDACGRVGMDYAFWLNDGDMDSERDMVLALAEERWDADGMVWEFTGETRTMDVECRPENAKEAALRDAIEIDQVAGKGEASKGRGVRL